MVVGGVGGGIEVGFGEGGEVLIAADCSLMSKLVMDAPDGGLADISGMVVDEGG